MDERVTREELMRIGYELLPEVCTWREVAGTLRLLAAEAYVAAHGRGPIPDYWNPGIAKYSRDNGTDERVSQRMHCDNCDAPLFARHQVGAWFTDGTVWCRDCAPKPILGTPNPDTWIDRVARGEGCA